MPSKSVKFCAHPGCKEMVTGYYCEAHRPAPQPWQAKQGNKKAKPHSSWYSDPTWRRLRMIQLREFPLCAECERNGTITPATIVDHIIPHRGKWEMFVDGENLQSLCASCHNRKTAKEDGGYGNKPK
ncbi:HNH endonuclease [bacterium]|nr:MAG: HNH endonuclease [bacterium]